MATYSLDYFAGIPHGIKVYTTHTEACSLRVLQAAIAAILGWMGGPWLSSAALALALQAEHIGDLARKDNCKGLVIRFSFVFGVIWSIERRGFGPSVCFGTCRPAAGGTSDYPPPPPPTPVDDQWVDLGLPDYKTVGTVDEWPPR